MAVDAQIQVLLDQFADRPEVDLTSLDVDEFRGLFDAMSVTVAGLGDQDVTAEDLVIAGPGGELALRRYTPLTRSAALLMFFHGGGWTLGSIKTHDASCRDLAAASGVNIISVEYRLAPEHPFPAPLDDCYAALQWAHDHAADLGVSPERIAVGGDSAGGNLAAAVSLLARQHGGPAICYQLLVYPGLDLTSSQPSIKENGQGYFLTAEAIEWFSNNYIGDWDKTDPLASPLFVADLTGLPPTYVLTCGYDPLRDEGEAYAARLAQAGVPVTLRRYDDQIHGAFGMQAVSESSVKMISETGAELARALSA